MPGPDFPISPTSSAIARAKALAIGQTAPSLSGGFYPLPDPQMTHPENTTVFVGGLPGSVGRDELIAVFKPFGEVTYVNIPTGKGCGFISFDNRPSAEWAIEQLQGFWLHGAQLRLAWGRLQGCSDKPPKQSELSSQIQLDLPFFTQMLDLRAEQQVKLGLYLEFAQGGNIGRLKDIMSVSSASALGLKVGPPTSCASSQSNSATSSRRPYTQPSVARDDPYQSHGDLCKHYDRLVSDAPSSGSEALCTPSRARDSISGMSTSANSSTPPLSFGSDPSGISPPYSTSPLPTPSSGSMGGSVSVSDEAVFRAFQATPPRGHRHSETCVTPLSLRKLDKQHSAGSPGQYDRVTRGMGYLGLNAGAGEWVPGYRLPEPAKATGRAYMGAAYGAKW